MLEVKDLFCGYDSRMVLKGISLSIERGGLLGLIGPNGSGKTTFLRAITRVLNPREGSVLIEGKDLGQMGYRGLAQKVAVVPQGVFADSMRVEDFVLLGRIPHYKKFQLLETAKDKDIARRSLKLTGTFNLKERNLSELSGGEKQLVLIARALAQEPCLLLLDEPTTHLDITHQVGAMDLIRRLNKEMGLTVLMVLHDLNLASEYCRTIALINKGVVYKIGSPREVLTYQTIEEVYQTTVVIGKNPVSSKPYCFLVSEEEKRKG